MSIHTTKLTDTVGFEILGKALGKDVEVSLGKAIAAGAVFCAGSDPLLVPHGLRARTAGPLIRRLISGRISLT